MTYSGSKALVQNDFDQWALRSGYLGDAFSGEVQLHAIDELVLLDLTVPKGQTWYRRQMWYSVTGGRVAEFKVWRTLPGGSPEYFNRVVVSPGTTEQVDTRGKYPAGSRIRVSVKPHGLAVTTDIVTARLLYIALPWEE